MDEIELIKKRLKSKRLNKINGKNNTNNRTSNYVNNLITRILLSIIIFFGLIIFINSNKNNASLIKENIFEKNLSFTKISNLYTKYFGNIIPLQNLNEESATVFNEKFIYDEITDYRDGYSFKVTNNYLMPILKSGIVVFIGEKEGLGNTVIVQGIDEVDYWYSNIQNMQVELYDYVTEGTLLGTATGNTLYMTFQKNGEYLSYDEITED